MYGTVVGPYEDISSSPSSSSSSFDILKTKSPFFELSNEISPLSSSKLIEKIEKLQFNNNKVTIISIIGQLSTHINIINSKTGNLAFQRPFNPNQTFDYNNNVNIKKLENLYEDEEFSIQIFYDTQKEIIYLHLISFLYYDEEFLSFFHRKLSSSFSSFDSSHNNINNNNNINLNNNYEKNINNENNVNNNNNNNNNNNDNDNDNNNNNNNLNNNIINNNNEENNLKNNKREKEEEKGEKRTSEERGEKGTMTAILFLFLTSHFVFIANKGSSIDLSSIRIFRILQNIKQNYFSSLSSHLQSFSAHFQSILSNFDRKINYNNNNNNVVLNVPVLYFLFYSPSFSKGLFLFIF